MSQTQKNMKIIIEDFVQLFWDILDKAKDTENTITISCIEGQINRIKEEVSQLSPDEIMLFQFALEHLASKLVNTLSGSENDKVFLYNMCLSLITMGKDHVRALLERTDELVENVNFLIDDQYLNNELTNIADDILVAKFGKEWRTQTKSLFSKNLIKIAREITKLIDDEVDIRLFQWSPIRKLMKDCGADMVTRDAVDSLIYYLERLIKNVIRQALMISKQVDEQLIEKLIKQYTI
ncbi:hypothetical protein LCGC14_1648880 [marine sediment metagenome]|uniref:Uncharacterized protein n=1 Tax=marine sediment metagenome TaxID=412755 RepID=A0A0F9IK01_9ZZZZ